MFVSDSGSGYDSGSGSNPGSGSGSGSDSGSEENISLLKMEVGSYKTVGSVFLESIIVITGSCSLSILADSLAQCLPCVYRVS